MTTIAVKLATKGAPATIACDLQYTYSGHTKFKGASKIITLAEPIALEMFGVPKAFIGFSGNADVWGNVVRWFSNPTTKPPKVKNIEFVMLNKEGIYHATDFSNWTGLDVKHFSIGSGMQLAMGSMEAGATPLEACKYASKLDPMTGMGFKEFVL